MNTPEKNTRRSMNPKPGARARVAARALARAHGREYVPWSHEKGKDFPMDQRKAAQGRGFERLFDPNKLKGRGKRPSRLARRVGRGGGW